ncbi:TIGR00266 family protein [Candidatus Woesearchaeota archaeon]|nr:TIGR00266 family protein [Candidatus Woesearchaeota archaeon]|tara:strand:+ start:1451 stop:2191 length:741 start_codon:yes stop_codon:yes gene_type:complete
MKFKITGTVMQTVGFELNKNETIYSESGGMSWMSDNIRMLSNTRGGLVEGIKRRFSGESIFLNTFTCTGGKGIITFASEFPGKIIPIKFDEDKEIICQKDAFMCAQEGVKLRMYFRKRLGAGFFGGEGFILQKLSGKGYAFVELAGEIIEMTLKKDQTLRVDTGHIAMFEPSVDFDIELVEGVKNIFFGGEGLFWSTLTGPGKVWLQSMPLANLAGKIGRYFSTGRSSGGLGTGIRGAISNIGGGG